MGLLPHVRQDLFEQGGCYAGFPPNPLKPQPGMGSCEIAERYPGWTIDPRINPEGWWLEEEYETQERARLRAIQVRDWIQLSIQPQDFAAMVVHADFKLLLLEAMLDTTQILEWLEPFFNTSVTQLTWQPDRWRVDMWNSVAHLPSELITH
jgi:2,3-bisphosphoglycerate-dependent phosphoglycerate mutase